MERVNNIILKHGYHKSENLVENALKALGLWYWQTDMTIEDFPEEIKKEKKWMSKLNIDEAKFIQVYILRARSLAYRYLRSKTSSNKKKQKITLD